MGIVVDVGNFKVIEKNVSKFGNSGHAFVPKEYAGEDVKIIFGESVLSRGKLGVDFLGGEIVGRKVKKFGTGAHVIVPREYIGKIIKLVIVR